MYKTTIHRIITLLVLLGFFMNPMCAQNMGNDDVNLNKTPPRIIRACCAFGYDLKIWGVPFINIDQVIGIDELNKHHYMGHKKEGTGTVYSHKGGFIDIGHMRDQIDWTRYLYTTILHYRGKGEIVLPLRNEAGRKTLQLNVPEEFSNSDCILLAGKITYDFSLWHEISTWFGASTIPFIKEKFSSFSIEDMYSNLLGVHIGMKSLHSKLLFNEATTRIIESTLDSLDVVKTAKETYDAYDAINHKWYTDKKRIPSKNVTIKRDPDILNVIRPWIIPNYTDKIEEPVTLEVPKVNMKGELLTSFYQFTIDLNYRFPVEEIFPDRENSLINQDDFKVLIDRIIDEVALMEQNILAEKK